MAPRETVARQRMPWRDWTEHFPPAIAAPPAGRPPTARPGAARRVAARRMDLPTRVTRRPVVGLAGLVVLSLLAMFFAAVTVEPLWLAVGHGDPGVARVTRCTGKGVGQRCVGEFTAADGAFRVTDVAVLGVDEAERRTGTTVAASMVSPTGHGAYVTDPPILHLRWAVGLGLVLACGLGIALATGANRLAERRARVAALATSVAGPLLIVAVSLGLTF